MSEAQIKILLENNELDLLIFELKIAYGSVTLTQPARAAKISKLLSKLYSSNLS